MTSFFGLVSLNGQPRDDTNLERLSEALTPVGDYRTGIWRNQQTCLGCHLVATTPEAQHEQLPLTDADDDTVITGAIRLDNRAELLRALGVDNKSMGDGQLILRAYRAWGEDCCSRLLGDFAFALWDNSSQTLFCASDHIGARPLYYANTPGYFAFASNPEALACLNGIEAVADDLWMMSFIAPELGFAYGDRTSIKGVSRLAGGHYLRLSGNQPPQVQRYWHIEQCPELSLRSDDDVVDAFREIFDRAMAARLRSISPPAVLVSGGMDTAGLIGSLARMKATARPPALPRDAYSIIADDPESCVESRCIQSLVSCAGLSAHYLKVPSISGICDIDTVLRSAWEKPDPADNSLLIIRLLADQAHRDGHRVVLNGVSGDLSQMAPDPYIAPLLRGGQWLTAWRESRAAAHHHTYLYGRSPSAILLQNLFRALAPLSLQRRKAASTARRIDGIHPFARREFFELSEMSQRLHEQQINALERLTFTHQEHFAHSLPMFATGLRGYQRLGALCGVDMRDPWSDRKLIEFYYRLPLKMKVRCGWTKFLARKANANVLPAEVIWRRSKEHLGFHVHRAAIAAGSDYTDAIVAEHLGLLEPYFDTVRLKLAYDQIKKGDTREYPDVYYPLTLAAWLADLNQLKKSKHP